MSKIWKYIFLGAIGRGAFIFTKEAGIVVPEYIYWITLAVLLPIAGIWFYNDYVKKPKGQQGSQGK